MGVSTNEILLLLTGSSLGATAAIHEVQAGLGELEGQAQTTGGTFGKIAGAVLKFSLIAVAAVGTVAATTVDLASKFDSAMTLIQAKAHMTTAETKAMGDEFLSTGGKVTYSATQIATAFAPVAEQLATTEKHTLTAGEALLFMNGAMALADSTGTDLNTSTKELAAVMQAYSLPVKDAASASDILFNISAKLNDPLAAVAMVLDRIHGVLGDATPPLAQVAGLMEELASNGVPARTVTTDVTAAFQSLIAPTTSVAKELAKLKIPTLDSKGDFLGMSKVLSELRPKFEAMTPAQQKLTAAMIFGKPASEEMLKVILAGPAAYLAATAAVSKAGSAQTAAQIATANFQGALGKLKTEVQDTAIKIGNFLMPYATAFANWITVTAIPALTKFGTWLWNNVVTPFAHFVSVVWPPLQKAFEWIVQNFPAIMKVVAPVAAVLLTMWAVDKIAKWGQTAVSWITTVAKNFAAGKFGSLFTNTSVPTSSSGITSAMSIVKVFIVGVDPGAFADAGPLLVTQIGVAGEPAVPEATDLPTGPTAINDTENLGPGMPNVGINDTAAIPAVASTESSGAGLLGLGFSGLSKLLPVAGVASLGSMAGGWLGSLLGKPGSKESQTGNIVGSIGGGAAAGAAMGTAVLPVFGTLIGGVVGAIVGAIPVIIQHWSQISSAVISFFKTIFGWFHDLPGHIADLWNNVTTSIKNFFVGIGAWFGRMPGQIAGFFTMIWGHITGFFGMLTKWFHDLPGKIWDFISSLPGKIVDWFKAQNWFQIGRNIRNAIVGFFELIVNWFKSLPGDIWSYVTGLAKHIGDFFAMLGKWFASLPGQLVAILAGVWKWITGFFVGSNSLGAWFAALPGRIAGFFASVWKDITGFFGAVGKWFAGLPAALVSIIAGVWGDIAGPKGLFASIGNWFKGLPAALVSVFAGVWSHVTGVFGAIGRFFAGIPGALAHILKNIPVIGGLVNFFSGLFSEGGVANAPMSGGLAVLHGEEAILPRNKAGALWGPVLQAIKSGPPAAAAMPTFAVAHPTSGAAAGATFQAHQYNYFTGVSKPDMADIDKRLDKHNRDLIALVGAARR